MFSTKATKIAEIFIVNLTLCICQIDGEDFVYFVAFLEDTNFNFEMAFCCLQIYQKTKERLNKKAHNWIFFKYT